MKPTIDHRDSGSQWASQLLMMGEADELALVPSALTAATSNE
jgi:hypothetical protein